MKANNAKQKRNKSEKAAEEAAKRNRWPQRSDVAAAHSRRRRRPQTDSGRRAKKIAKDDDSTTTTAARARGHDTTPLSTETHATTEDAGWGRDGRGCGRAQPPSGVFCSANNCNRFRASASVAIAYDPSRHPINRNCSSSEKLNERIPPPCSNIVNRCNSTNVAASRKTMCPRWVPQTNIGLAMAAKLVWLQTIHSIRSSTVICCNTCPFTHVTDNVNVEAECAIKYPGVIARTTSMFEPTICFIARTNCPCRTLCTHKRPSLSPDTTTSKSAEYDTDVMGELWPGMACTQINGAFACAKLDAVVATTALALPPAPLAEPPPTAVVPTLPLPPTLAASHSDE